jgi:hypothetical protein
MTYCTTCELEYVSTQNFVPVLLTMQKPRSGVVSVESAHDLMVRVKDIEENKTSKPESNVVSEITDINRVPLDRVHIVKR